MYNLNHIIKKITGAGKALLLVTLLLATGAVWAQNTQTLKGRIVDTEGNPIAGAVVNVAEESRIVLSDENGYFSLKNANRGRYTCRDSGIFSCVKKRRSSRSSLHEVCPSK